MQALQAERATLAASLEEAGAQLLEEARGREAEKAREAEALQGEEGRHQEVGVMGWRVGGRCRFVQRRGWSVDV